MDMSFALFLGCTIPARLPGYEISARAVLGVLGVDVAVTDRFNCCGYPIRNLSFRASLLASARNLALAEGMNLNMITLCQCCYGTLKMVDHLLKQNEGLREEINASLRSEGLAYRGSIEVKHLLSVLHDLVGLEAIRNRVVHHLDGLKIAVHYGCHALRPSDIVKLDNSDRPVIFDRLVDVTGAVSVSWPFRLECCGAPLLGVDNALSIHLGRKKLSAVKQAGADLLCVGCSYCHLQFDKVGKDGDAGRRNDAGLPCILYPQLLGLSLGMDGETLGLDSTRITDLLRRH
ncbi:MAG: CoB--CoM heterodisulfide reductase iron-sulfur subunit B family protein [Thermodesulfobacteriota bacterium]